MCLSNQMTKGSCLDVMGLTSGVLYRAVSRKGRCQGRSAQNFPVSPAWSLDRSTRSIYVFGFAYLVTNLGEAKGL